MAASDAHAAPKPGAGERKAPSDAEKKDAARKMAREALELMHQERWGEAHGLLSRAYQLVPAPTVALLDGRALERLGRLIEARDRYRAAARAKLDADAPEAFRQAAADAAKELEQIRDKIPKITIVLQGTGARRSELLVSLDNEPLSLEAIDEPRPVDPGDHVVSVQVGGELAVEDHVFVKEGETKQVVLGLGHVSSESPPPAEAEPMPPSESTGGQSVLGWTLLGVGAAGLGVGVAAGVIMLDAKSTLDESCSPGCPPSVDGDLSRFRTARTVSAIGYVAGGVGVGVGAVLLIFLPRRPSEDVGYAPFSNGRVVGVEGTF